MLTSDSEDDSCDEQNGSPRVEIQEPTSVPKGMVPHPNQSASTPAGSLKGGFQKKEGVNENYEDVARKQVNIRKESSRRTNRELIRKASSMYAYSDISLDVSRHDRYL